MKPLRIFSCVTVDVESHYPMRFSWKDIGEIYIALTKKRMPLKDHIFIWFIAFFVCAHFENDLAEHGIPPKFGVRSLCLFAAWALFLWGVIHNKKGKEAITGAFFEFMLKRDYTIKDSDWLMHFLDSGGLFFDDTKRKAIIVLSSFDKNDVAACSVFVDYLQHAISKKQYDPLLVTIVKTASAYLTSARSNEHALALLENFDKALPAWEGIAAKYNGGSSLKYWEVAKQKVRVAIKKVRDPNERQYCTEAVEAFIDSANEAGAALVASILAMPIPARVVEVDKAAGKSLRAAMQDPGGRPKKTAGGAKVPTQAEMAVAFGEPCNEEMIANWEARAAGKRRGANPPDALYKGERIVYSAELRLNPTPDNKNRLAALITEFQSRHRFKAAVGEKAKIIHARSEETSYRMQHPDGRVRTQNRGD